MEGHESDRKRGTHHAVLHRLGAVSGTLLVATSVAQRTLHPLLLSTFCNAFLGFCKLAPFTIRELQRQEASDVKDNALAGITTARGNARAIAPKRCAESAAVWAKSPLSS
jgi:hypothetical protein